jgi:hypothetical protein
MMANIALQLALCNSMPAGATHLLGGQLEASNTDCSVRKNSRQIVPCSIQAATSQQNAQGKQRALLCHLYTQITLLDGFGAMHASKHC